MREEILSLLSGRKIDIVPAFSGLIHITMEGLERGGLSLHEVHHDAGKMAKAAASTFKLTGMPSATLPLDLCAPAEMLGAELNFYEGSEAQFPQVKKALFESAKDLTTKNTTLTEIHNRGRYALICEAIRSAKNDIGKDAVISGLIPGPYTLLLYLCSPKNLFIEMKKEPQFVLDALYRISSFLAKIGEGYREAGADFITIHDMGGSPGFIGPAKYEQFVHPFEKMLIEKLPKPIVLSVCGSVKNSLHLLAETGANAVSLDQTVDLTIARPVLKDTLLFGNLDPIETLYRGDSTQVREAVIGAREAGADAIWPGCDLVIESPIQNIRAMQES
jgi:[methyl-Co(III) methanol-specific corrinoid protein]:coenzyme M methyltransferase